MPAEHRPPPGSDLSIADRKSSLRAELVSARRARSAAQRQAAGSANASHLLAALRSARTVCGYLPLRSEPLSAMLWDALGESGVRVLLPVVAGAAPLDWAEHRQGQDLRKAALGIAEPTGRRLGPGAAAAADAVVLPALAVDSEGHRLGRGGGHYDRTAALIAAHGATPALLAVVYDEEFVAAVPFDGWDVRATGVVTPGGGVRTL